MSEYRVYVSQLRVGVFIRLEVSWLNHPFFFSRFKITSPKQIEALKEVGITTVLCIPEKSDQIPVPKPVPPPPPPPPPTPKPPGPVGTESPDKGAAAEEPASAEEEAEAKRLWEEKKVRIEELKKQRARVQECERVFAQSVNTVKRVMFNLTTGSSESFEEAELLISSLVDNLLNDKDSSVQVMNASSGKENIFYHSLNVTVLSMILGREFHLDGQDLHELGLGALFHDIGKSRIPKALLLKTGPLSQAEQKLIQLHPQYGAEILSKIHVSSDALQVVRNHHEICTGKGYPNGLGADQISRLVKISSIANAYDNHCNKPNPEDSLTPYEAVSFMFAKQRDHFDPELLNLFVHSLGVYPPGTILKLSNGLVGMVISVNPQSRLRPNIIIYDPDIPSTEALIFDLNDDPSLKVEKTYRPAELPKEVFEYLKPRTRVTYYVSSGQPETAAPRKG